MTARRFEIYKCQACGIVAEILDGGAGEIICCGQPMQRLSEKTQDQGKEKHVPVVSEVDEGVKVAVGSVPHPMEEKHYIEWIEIVAAGREYRKFLEPGQAPEAVFEVEKSEIECVREHCNVHGLWKA